MTCGRTQGPPLRRREIAEQLFDGFLYEVFPVLRRVLGIELHLSQTAPHQCSIGGIEHAPTVGRMYGDRAERVASAAISLYREQVDRPWLETGERLDLVESRRGSQAGRRLLDQTEQLLLALYRRAIDDGMLAGWLETTESLMARHGLLAKRTRVEPGVAFVDRAGSPT